MEDSTFCALLDLHFMSTDAHSKSAASLLSAPVTIVTVHNGKHISHRPLKLTLLG